jgi:hypothetical protein
MRGVDDAAGGVEGEGGDVFIDVCERLVEILGGGRKKAKEIYAENTESAEDTEKREPRGHGFGCGAV